MGKKRQQSRLEPETEVPACPDCGFRVAVPICYGFPDEELQAAAGAGQVVLGGCVVEAAEWYCPGCRLAWPEEPSQDRVDGPESEEILEGVARFTDWAIQAASEEEGDPFVERYWEREGGRRTFLVRFGEGLARVEKTLGLLTWGGVPEYEARMGWADGMLSDEARIAAIRAAMRFERRCGGAMGANRFLMTPDTTELLDAVGRKKTWVLSDHEYPSQHDEEGQPVVRRTDVIIDPEYCRVRENGGAPGRRTLIGARHKVIGQIGVDVLVVAGGDGDRRWTEPAVLVRLSTGEVSAPMASQRIFAEQRVAAVRLGQAEVDRALELAGESPGER